MAKGIKIPKAYTKQELSSFVAAEVEALLVKFDPALKRPAVVSAAKLAGAATGAYAFLSLKQQHALGLALENAEQRVDAFVSELALAAYRQSVTEVDDEDADEPSRSSLMELPGDMTIDSWVGPAAGPTFLERNYGIARSTLHRWQKRNEVIALLAGGRKHVFPLAQFVDGRPAEGLQQVQQILGHPRIAWRWLIEPNASLEGQLPINLLKIDRQREVFAAAEEFAKQTPNT